jgi:hypothetical protein
MLQAELQQRAVELEISIPFVVCGAIFLIYQGIFMLLDALSIVINHAFTVVLLFVCTCARQRFSYDIHQKTTVATIFLFFADMCLCHMLFTVVIKSGFSTCWCAAWLAACHQRLFSVFHSTLTEFGLLPLVFPVFSALTFIIYDAIYECLPSAAIYMHNPFYMLDQGGVFLVLTDNLHLWSFLLLYRCTLGALPTMLACVIRLAMGASAIRGVWNLRIPTLDADGDVAESCVPLSAEPEAAPEAVTEPEAAQEAVMATSHHKEITRQCSTEQLAKRKSKNQAKRAAKAVKRKLDQDKRRASLPTQPQKAELEAQKAELEAEISALCTKQQLEAEQQAKQASIAAQQNAEQQAKRKAKKQAKSEAQAVKQMATAIKQKAEEQARRDIQDARRAAKAIKQKAEKEAEHNIEEARHAARIIKENAVQQAKRTVEEAQAFAQLEARPVESIMQPGPPDEYFCPITLEIMTNPVLASDGHTYERKAIEAWMARSGTRPVSPKTNAPLLTHLTPNHSLRCLIMDRAQ